MKLVQLQEARYYQTDKYTDWQVFRLNGVWLGNEKPPYFDKHTHVLILNQGDEDYWMDELGNRTERMDWVDVAAESEDHMQQFVDMQYLQAPFDDHDSFDIEDMWDYHSGYTKQQIHDLAQKAEQRDPY